MGELKLNRKLAEWAGFICERDGKFLWSNPVWWQPDRKLGTKQPPDFTQSLDACFKWLVPKLYGQGYYYDLLQWSCGWHKAIINERTVEWAVIASSAVAETPALALCLAIKKLIDKSEGDYE